jgi:hypothetical protein
MKGQLSSAPAVAVLALLASLALHAYPVVRPMIAYDDFNILVKSLRWRTAWDNVWVPANEHAMPLGRLSTALVVHLAGRQTLLPFFTALQGPFALLTGLGLLYFFVRRELGHPYFGLIAMILFGVTSIYHQAVSWFAAGFSVLTLDTLLLSLLAAQAWCNSGKIRYLMCCLLWCGLAPGWFASGVLAGPLCSLYLVAKKPRSQGLEAESSEPGERGLFGLRLRAIGLHVLITLLPLLGTAAFLTLSLPRTAAAIMHLPHYGTETALGAFDPFEGLINTGRSLVDNLALGVIGISGVHCPPVLVPVALLLLAWLIIRWWRPAPQRAFLWLGLGTIVLGYLLVYGARARVVPYEGHMHGTAWGRYHLLPQLGLTLLICGALPGWRDRLFQLCPDGSLTARQAKALALAIGILFVVQLPRDLFATTRYDPTQQEAFARIEEMDRRCRAHHIAAEAARAVLPPLPVPGCGDTENGWEFLWGSPTPQPLTKEEIRRLLLGD